MILTIGPTVGASCRCLNRSTSIGGTRSIVECGDRHDLEPESMRKDTRHEVYTGSGRQSSVIPYVLFGCVYCALRLGVVPRRDWDDPEGIGDVFLGTRPSFI